MRRGEVRGIGEGGWGRGDVVVGLEVVAVVEGGCCCCCWEGGCGCCGLVGGEEAEVGVSIFFCLVI